MVKNLVRRVLTALPVLVLVLTNVTPAFAAGQTLNGHSVILDGSNKIIPWVDTPDQAYSTVSSLAWDYLLHQVPNDPNNGQPAYFSHSYLNPDTQQVVNWPSNPAGMNAMLIEAALEYYQYSGDAAVLQFARNLADHHLAAGMTATTDNWPSVPYASGDSGSLTYQGASYGNTTGTGDGAGYIEPDKLGEFGYSLLKLYEQTGNTAYRSAAIASADALASHVRTGNATQSPWPFRVNAQTGAIREQYTADVINPIQLFDELNRLGLGNTASYQTARATAWAWLMQYPMVNNTWSNYFEDVDIQPNLNNTNQLIAMMTARYLLLHPETDANWEAHVRGLIAWVESTFGISQYGALTIKEQQVFAYAMGSHTSRYASVNALLYEKTGDTAAKEKAYRSYNWATYMMRANGVGIDGPSVNNQWFTDSYGDYIRHFMVGMGASPDWAPNGQTHLVESNSVVTSVSYSPTLINYTTFDQAGIEKIKVASTPTAISVGGVQVAQRTDLSAEGWTYDPAAQVLQIRHDSAGSVAVGLDGTAPNQLPTVSLSAPAGSYNAPAAFTLTATAADSDGTITKVEFYQDGTLLGTATTAPYTWDISNLPAGNYNFTAIAYDNQNATKTSSPVTISVTQPGAWTGADVGSVGVPGSTTVSGGTVTVKGSGVDIWDAADSFQFGYQQMTGDGEVKARVVTQQNTDEWALAGIMIRDSLAANAKEVLVAKTPSHGIAMDYRTATGGQTTYINGSTGNLPYCLRLTRTGTNITAYKSANGTSWTQVGSTTVSMGSTVYVGMAVTSHVNSTLGTATFDNVSFTGQSTTPPPDTTPPVISSVASGTPNQNGVTITWATDEPASSQVEYGTTTSYGTSTALNTSLDTAHSQVVSGLNAATTYHYRVHSTDAAGNHAVSGDFSFTTPSQQQPQTLALDTKVVKHGTTASTTITSPALTTAGTNELLVAFVSSDGPGSTSMFNTVSGGGLTWTLRKRVNAQAGTSEIWTAPAPAKVTSKTITATRSGSYRSSLVVAAFSGADLSTIGATGGASAATGAPSVSITTTRAGSWVWGVGNDWDGATARTIGPNQTKQDEFLTGSGDTLWVQSQTTTTPTSGTLTTLNDTAPTNHRWNFAAIEILTAR